MALKLRKIEKGLYETLDGAYRVQSNLALDEWDAAETFWTVEKVINREHEITTELAERPTKRECVEYLARHLGKEE